MLTAVCLVAKREKWQVTTEKELQTGGQENAKRRIRNMSLGEDREVELLSEC